jgi:hypothetical protein
MNDLHRKNVYERSGLLRMCYSPCKEGYIPSITSESCKKGPDNIPSYCPVQMIKNIENTGKLDIGRKSYNDLKMLINKKYEVFDIEKYVNDMNKYMNECEFTFKNYDFIGKSVCENGDTSKELSDLCKLQYCNTGNNVDCISCLKYDNPIQSDIEKKINDVYDNMKTNNILIITFSIIVLLIIYVKAIQSIQN